MTGKLTTRYRSETVLIQDYQCAAEPGSLSTVESTDHFEITYTRTGAFHYHARGKATTVDNSLLWLLNAGTEQRIGHDHNVRDTCTIFRYPIELIHAGMNLFGVKSCGSEFRFPLSLIPVTARIDYFHHRILQEARSKHSLTIDTLALRFLEEVLKTFSGKMEPRPNPSDYLEKIERAKAYILQNFERNLSLKEIARNTYMSEFHFSRVFHAMTQRTPHQYLLDVRFQHAILLLRNTSRSITDVCYASGFQNYPHFVAAFARRYGISPLQFKKQDFVRIA
jgi:AraC-like DNA-binding protein